MIELALEPFRVLRREREGGGCARARVRGPFADGRYEIDCDLAALRRHGSERESDGERDDADDAASKWPHGTTGREQPPWSLELEAGDVALGTVEVVTCRAATRRIAGGSSYKPRTRLPRYSLAFLALPAQRCSAPSSFEAHACAASSPTTSAAESARRSDRMRSSQRNASTHNPCSAFATRISLLISPLAVEPVEQTEQRADLTGQARGSVADPRQGLEQLVRVLDPVGDRIRRRLQVLYCLGVTGCWSLPPPQARCARLLRSWRLRLVGLRGVGREVSERPGVGADLERIPAYRSRPGDGGSSAHLISGRTGGRRLPVWKHGHPPRRPRGLSCRRLRARARTRSPASRSPAPRCAHRRRRSSRRSRASARGRPWFV